MVVKRKKTAKQEKRPREFDFILDGSDSGKLTYRCLELIITDNDNEVMSDEVLGLINQIVDTLNDHFPHLS